MTRPRRSPSFTRSSHIRAAVLVALFAVFSVSPALPQEQEGVVADQDQRKTLAILPAKVQPAVVEANRKLGPSRELSLERVAQGLDTQLTDAINGVRQFRVIARNDLPEVLDDQDLQDTFSTGSERAPERFRIEGADYLLIPTVDDFRDVSEQLRGDAGRVVAVKRDISLSLVVRIYDSESGELLESASFQVTAGDGQRLQAGLARNDPARFSRLLNEVTREASLLTAWRVLDVIYPARVLARTGDLVTISRGDGTGIEAGQPWTVFALGEELTDPVTGMSFGQEEIEIGTVRVTRVTPLTSQARVVEDFGIERGQILRQGESRQ